MAARSRTRIAPCVRSCAGRPCCRCSPRRRARERHKEPSPLRFFPAPPPSGALPTLDQRDHERLTSDSRERIHGHAVLVRALGRGRRRCARDVALVCRGRSCIMDRVSSKMKGCQCHDDKQVDGWSSTSTASGNAGHSADLSCLTAVVKDNAGAFSTHGKDAFDREIEERGVRRSPPPITLEGRIRRRVVGKARCAREKVPRVLSGFSRRLRHARAARSSA